MGVATPWKVANAIQLVSCNWIGEWEFVPLLLVAREVSSGEKNWCIETTSDWSAGPVYFRLTYRQYSFH